MRLSPHHILAKAGQLPFVKVLGKSSGYISAANSWWDFANNRTTTGFIKAGAISGLAVASLHPFVNIATFVCDYSGVSERAYEWMGDKTISSTQQLKSRFRTKY